MEPTVRPGLAGWYVSAEGKQPQAARQPETGCKSATTKDPHLQRQRANQGSSNKVYVIGVGMTRFKPGGDAKAGTRTWPGSRAPKRCDARHHYRS